MVDVIVLLWGTRVSVVVQSVRKCHLPGVGGRVRDEDSFPGECLDKGALVHAC